jgi:hypothetical protein
MCDITGPWPSQGLVTPIYCTISINSSGTVTCDTPDENIVSSGFLQFLKARDA